VRLLLEFVPHSGQSQLHALVRPLGLGIGILPEVAILASHRVFKREGGVSAGDQRGNALGSPMMRTRQAATWSSFWSSSARLWAPS
jgi:hypothetical protein